MGISILNPAAAAAAFSGLTRRDQVTSTGTWTHPDGASSENKKQAVVIALGGGGGGASGGNAIDNVNVVSCSGGSGGSAGAATWSEFLVTGTLTITIGSGGTGGAAKVLFGDPDRSNTGNAGSIGGSTTVVDASGFGIIAYGGTGGVAGTGNNGGTVDTAAPAQATYSQNITTSAGVGGIGGGERAGDSATRPSDNVYGSFATGGSGGGGSSASTAYSGGTTSNPFAGMPGTGGNGGAGALSDNANATATAGSNGSGYGAGGGGGGGTAIKYASTARTGTSGAGGNGAPGSVWIYYQE